MISQISLLKEDEIIRMGIQGLLPFIREKVPGAIGVAPITFFSGRRVAIDAFNVAYINMSTARREVISVTDLSLTEPDQGLIMSKWKKLCVDSILRWLSYCITPVFVFDGQALPDKGLTKKKRKEEKDKLREKIKEAEKAIRSGDVLLQTASQLSEYRKLLCQLNTLSSKEIEAFQDILVGLGIPWCQAKHDGEQLCSMLCLEQKVVAVASTDSDNLAYGCPVVITGFAENTYDSNGQKLAQCNYINQGEILKQLDLDQKTFLDMCIMSGCDYNQNMNRIGVATSYKLLKHHLSIDKLPAKYDVKCLNHQRCREIFSYQKSTDLVEDGKFQLDIDHSKLVSIRAVLAGVGLAHYTDRFVNCYRAIRDGSSDASPMAIIKIKVKPKASDQEKDICQKKDISQGKSDFKSNPGLTSKTDEKKQVNVSKTNNPCDVSATKPVIKLMSSVK